jgi:hypothetical protein
MLNLKILGIFITKNKILLLSRLLNFATNRFTQQFLKDKKLF